MPTASSWPFSSCLATTPPESPLVSPQRSVSEELVLITGHSRVLGSISVQSVSRPHPMATSVSSSATGRLLTSMGVNDVNAALRCSHDEPVPVPSRCPLLIDGDLRHVLPLNRDRDGWCCKGDSSPSMQCHADSSTASLIVDVQRRTRCIAP
jgi:hypothetical protein